MGLFGRKKGRHALGAAVTSIPSGPPAVAVVAPVHEVLVAPAAPAVDPPSPVHEAPVAPAYPATTAGAVAELLVTGEWESGSVASPPLLPPPLPVATPEAPAVPAAAVPTPLPPAPVVPQPLSTPVPATVVELTPPAPPAPRAPVPSSLEAALTELLPTQSASAADEPAPASPSRVQLGFRDGTSAPLDPESSQFAELEALAQSLTQRD